MDTTMITHTVASRDEWLAARAALLEREKQHTRMGDELARQRRELPWVAVDEAVHAADGGRPEVARGAVRRPLPAADLPLHVRPQLRGRLPGEHLDRRLVRQSDPAPEGSRRDVDRRLRGADREAAGVSRTDGVELSTGRRATRATSIPTSASRAASSRRGRRSSRVSTSCRRSRFATPRSPAPTSTAT